MSITTAKDLASYIVYKNNKIKHYKLENNSIRLQKSLYFLFAYWGGFIAKSENGRVEDKLYLKYDKYLFNDKIVAWDYGPVIESIINSSNINKCKKLKYVDSFVKKFIDDMLIDMFNCSEFRLIDIAQSDKVWKNKYDKPDNEMLKDDIINEYKNKLGEQK